MPKTKEDNTPYQDFITIEPEAVKFLDEDELALCNENGPILGALRKNYLTVKEIHALFYDEKDDSHKYSLPTIYRRIEQLSSAGLIQISGHRMYEGSHTTERLYSRTAMVFYPKPRERSEKSEEELEYNRLFTNSIRILLSHSLGIPPPDEKKAQELIEHLFGAIYNNTVELLQKASDIPEIADIYAESDLFDITRINLCVGILAFYLTKKTELAEVDRLFKIS